MRHRGNRWKCREGMLTSGDCVQSKYSTCAWKRNNTIKYQRWYFLFLSLVICYFCVRMEPRKWTKQIHRLPPSSGRFSYADVFWFSYTFWCAVQSGTQTVCYGAYFHGLMMCISRHYFCLSFSELASLLGISCALISQKIFFTPVFWGQRLFGSETGSENDFMHFTSFKSEIRIW